MATVGQSLTVPESGWRRYDDTDSRIKYNGAWSKSAVSPSSYGGGHSISSIVGDKANFKFYGTKIRLISPEYTNWSANSKITIDGIEYYASQYSSTLVWNILFFELLNLSLGVHTVEIETIVPGQVAGFTAIDIDSIGYLIHPILNQVSGINSMQTGDCIPCRYTALTSGVAGYFSELGTCTAAEIPITGTATPDGLFYLIKTNKGTLIADRVIQTNISWDILNTAKYIEGKLLTSPELLLHMEGIDGSTAIVDNSVNPKTFIAYGDAKVKTDNYKIGNSSVYFDGDGDYISTDAHTDFNFDAKNFTIEFWVKRDRIGVYEVIMGQGDSGGSGPWKINFNTDNTVRVSLYGTVIGSMAIDSSTTISDTNWHHIAIVRDNTTGYIFIDGRNSGSNPISSTAVLSSSSGKFSIGITGGYSANYFKGYIDEVRIMKDVALYKYSFTPPTTPLNSMPKGVLIRSLSGGCAYADANGNMSTTDKSLGAWPINNEWDKYIVNSDLGGKITKEDVDIWHHHRNANVSNGATSLCKDTISLSIGANTARVLRGRYTYSSTSQNYVNLVSSQPSSAVSAAWGFRPVLNYVESDIANEVIY